MDNPPEEALQDIVCKFIINLNKETLKDKVQVMFQIERAWWYYEDTLRSGQPNLRHYSSYGTFTAMLAERVPYIKSLLEDAQVALKTYAAFKHKIPVYGAILMDQTMERVLLVRGHAATSGWGFPKGKINHGEAEVECAAREVLEETGYNIEKLIKPNEFIECKGQNDKLHKLFIVVGLDPETCAFAPQMAGEIGAYGWHWLHELPVTREDADKAYIASGGKQHRFYMVQPFIGRLRNWVSRRRRVLGMPCPPWEGDSSKQPARNGAAAQTAHAQRSPAPQVAAPAAADIGLAADVQPINRPGRGQRHQEPAAAVLDVSHVPQKTANLVLSSDFRFDMNAVLACLAC